MKRFIIVAIACLAALSPVMAQLEIGMSVGYGFPTGSSNGGPPSFDAKYNGGGNYSIGSYKDEYLALGNGLKVGINACYNLTNNIGVMANVGISTLGGQTITQQYTDITITPNPVVTETWEVTSSPFGSVNLGLRLKSSIGAFEPYVYLAPGVMFLGEANVKYTIKQENIPMDSNWHGFPPLYVGGLTGASMRFAPGFSLTGGIGTRIKLSKKFGINVEFAPDFSFARMTEINDGSTTIIYKKDEGKLPASTADTLYVHGGPIMSFSSLGARVGVFYTF
jgi:hypothetical protein